jgi:hypothetical protein
MSNTVKAAALAPPGEYRAIDFTTAGTLPGKIGSWNEEWVSAIVQPSGATLYWRADGVAAAATTGIAISDGVPWLFENQPALLKAMSFIGGTARVHFFG